MSEQVMALGEMCVADIRYLIEDNPSSVSPDLPLEQALFDINVASPQPRRLYVVDRTGVLIGVVDLNMLVDSLFPLQAPVQGVLEISRLARCVNRTVADVMNPKPCFVDQATPLFEMRRLLKRQGLYELPVVDRKRHLIGQINIYRVIAVYLAEMGL